MSLATIVRKIAGLPPERRDQQEDLAYAREQNRRTAARLLELEAKLIARRK